MYKNGIVRESFCDREFSYITYDEYGQIIHKKHVENSSFEKDNAIYSAFTKCLDGDCIALKSLMEDLKAHL